MPPKLVTKEILASIVAGASGAKRVGLSAIDALPGINNVQDAIAQLAQSSAGWATASARGLVKASRAPNSATDVIALIVEEKGATNGVAPLDGSQKVPAANLPAINAATLDGLDSADFALADGTRLRAPRSTTAPLSPGPGQLWLDANFTPAVLKEYDGAAWQHVAVTRFREEGALLAYATEVDFLGAGVTAAYNAVTGRLEVTISGANVGSATEAAEGTTRQATATQIQNGDAGNLFATAARLKAELDRRLTPVRGEWGKSANQNHNGNGVWTSIAFDTEQADPNNWQTDPDTYTLPPGDYLIDASWKYASDSTSWRGARLLVGGAAYMENRKGAGSTNDWGITWHLHLGASTAVEVQSAQGVSATHPVQAGAKLYITKTA